MTAEKNNAPGLPLDAARVLADEFLEIRCMLLEIGASLDRMERGSDPADTAADPRHDTMRDGIKALLDDGCDRAETIQNIFSLAD